MNTKFKQLRCGFIGFGLIGGSIAKALKSAYSSIFIAAYNPDFEDLSAAKNDGIVDEIVGDINAGFPAIDVLFLCAPVLENEKNLHNLPDSCKNAAIITDVGSVKGKIVSIAQNEGFSSSFIGGHPMAGKEKFGYRNASATLFQEAYFLLTPAKDVPKDKIEFMKKLITLLGAKPMVVAPNRHDYLVSAISHLPHMAAYSLVNLVEDADDESGIMRMLAAGGFKDITRVASSSPDMWEQICMDNTDHIEKMLGDYINILTDLRSLLKSKDGKALHEFFENAKNYRDSF